MTPQDLANPQIPIKDRVQALDYFVEQSRLACDAAYIAIPSVKNKMLKLAKEHEQLSKQIHSIEEEYNNL